MGFFDWLFRRNKQQTRSTDSVTPTAPVAPPPAVPEDPPEDENWAEATTFVSRRLPPSAQREIKNLRALLGNGVQLYVWKPPPDKVCAPCRKFVNNGPYRVGEGLTGQAPVPGRESPHGDCRCVIAAAQG